MTQEALEREFLADPPGIADLDTWIETAAADWPSQKCVVKARVCAAEIAANLLEHGGHGEGPRRLQVRLSQTLEGVALDLADDGLPFDPTDRPPSGRETLSSATPGGRGLQAVKGLAKTLSYRRDSDRNHLHLTFEP